MIVSPLARRPPVSRARAVPPAPVPASAPRRDPQLALATGLTLVLGLAALAWSHAQDLALAYQDAAAHLNVARRVLDSATPGVAQLGTVWLPVPHLLLLPFVAVDALWRSGLAGGIVGLGSFVVTGVALFGAVRLWTGRAAAAWAGLATFALNPNALYLQTTALTEPILMAEAALATFFLLRWGRTGTTRDLTTAAVFAALGVGTRYDGWFYAVVVGGLILVTTHLATRDPDRTEGVTLAYVVVPAYAMFGWVFYNTLIFDDPLAFARGEHSAAFQQQEHLEAGRLLTKGDPVLSVVTYGWAIVDNLGGLVAAIAALGFAAYLLQRWRPATSLPLALLAPLPFNVLALLLGQTIILVPEAPPGGVFNVRYGVLALPAAAFFVGYLAHRLATSLRPAIAVGLVVLVLAAQSAAWIPGWPMSVVSVADGLVGLSADRTAPAASAYLRERYQGGQILIDESVAENAPLMLRAGIPMREYVATYSGPIWVEALREPAEHAEWVVMWDRGGDRVHDVLAGRRSFEERYVLRASEGGHLIYQRRQP